MNNLEILNLKKGPIKTDSIPWLDASNFDFKKPEIPEAQPSTTVTIPTGKNEFLSGDLKVRDAMTNLGFENDKIGWDGKNVTYNGSYFLTPDENIDGVTRINPNAFIQSVNNAFERGGVDDSIVGVSTYAAKDAKVPYSVTYGNGGVVMIGGVPVENAITIDGKAYAKRSSVENALNALKKTVDVKTPVEMVRQYKEDYADIMNMYLDKINNFEDFSYNPEEDPAFLAYKKQYTDDAKKAYDDIYGLGAARTGGYANSTAMTSAAQAYLEHISDLEDRIPELAELAYERYADDFDRLINGLEIYGLPKDIQLMEYDAELKDLERIDKATGTDYGRDWDRMEFEYQEYLDELEKQRYDDEFSYKQYFDQLEREDSLWLRDNITYPRFMLEVDAAERDAMKDDLYMQKMMADIEGKNIENEYKSQIYGLD